MDRLLENLNKTFILETCLIITSYYFNKKGEMYGCKDFEKL